MKSPLRAGTLGALCCVASACATMTPHQGLIISNVSIISPERNAPLEHAHVRIVDGRIAEVSKRHLRGEQNVDGRDRYLIPGLIDSHVHLALPPGFPAPMTAVQAAAHENVVAAALAQDPKNFLFFGFTTVIDLVGAPERTAQWNALDLRPDAYHCGAVAITNGEFRFVLYPYFSYDAPLEKRIPPVVDKAKHTPEAVIGRIAGDGAICLKMIYEEGFVPTAEEGRALVAAAHARNLPVLIHANRKRGQAFAVDIGVDMIVHGMWRDQNEDAALDTEARGILASITRDKIGYQPTTQVIVGLLDMLDKDYFARPGVTDVYPAALIDFYSSAESAATRPLWTRIAASVEAQKTRLNGTIGRATEVTRILNESNARLIFGSDTPSDLIHTNPAGLNGRLEMNNWIAAGVSEAKLFRALTIDNARMLHLENSIGTVETGKTANLLLLRANPLESVLAYDTVETVFLHGKPIARQMLSARRTAN